MIDGVSVVGSSTNPVGSTTSSSAPTEGVRRHHHHHHMGADQAAAQDQGPDSDEIQAALSQAVEDGTITQDQANALQQLIGQQTPQTQSAGSVYLPDGTTGQRQAPPEIQAVADKLGMSVGDLGSALHSGETLADLANQKGISVQDLNDAAASAAKTHLDQAVQAGRMDQSMEDSIISNIQSGQWLSGLQGFSGQEA